MVKKNTNYLQDILPIALLMVFGLFLLTMSSLNPFSKVLPGTDSSVFLYVADLMEKGGLPYKDVFDHKGPLLYFINYIGYSLFGRVGVWAIEVIFLWSSIIIAYFTAKLFTGVWQSFFATATVFSALPYYFQQGNFVEEYALPFILIGLYVFSKYFIQGWVLNKIPCFIAGLSMMMVLMLRPNMIAVWAVFVAFIFFHTIYIKKSKLLGRYVLFFSLGLIAGFIPFAIYLFANGIFKDFIDTYIIFNFSYTSDAKDSRLGLIYDFVTTGQLFSLAIVTVILLAFNKKVKDNMRIYVDVVLCFILVTLATVIMSGRMYLHYAITLLPCYIVPIALLYHYVEKKLLRGINRKTVKGFVSIVLIAVFFMPTLNAFKHAFIPVNVISENTYLNSSYLKSEAKREVSAVVKENTSEDDEIIVMSNDCIIYLEAQRKACSKYAFPEVTSVDEKMASEFIEDIKLNTPKAVVVPDSINDMPTTANDYVLELVEKSYNEIFDNGRYKVYLLNQ